jgi:hypothetical protein
MVYGEVDRHCVFPCAHLGRCCVKEFMVDFAKLMAIIFLMGVAAAGGG